MDIDEDAQEPGHTRRWLAWATAGLLVAGVVSAGTADSRGRSADERVVTAAGNTVDGIGLPASVTEPVAPPRPPATLPAPTTLAPTTVPKPPVTVRAPVATTAPPTTQKVRTPTSVAATTPTTAVSAAGRATVTVSNEAGHAFVVTVNGRAFQLAPGQSSGPVRIDPSPNGNDTVEVSAVADPSCGTGDADNYFDAGRSYRLTVVAGPGMCRTMPGPQLKVTPA